MRYVQHHFGVDMAAQYGIPCAILAQEIFYWVSRNAAEGRNIHDGRAWMYQTLSALEKLHPYLTRKQIRVALDKLVDAGLVVKGQYNKNPYDRTVWYSLTDAGVEWFTADRIELSGSDPTCPEFYVESRESAGRSDMPSRAHRDALHGTSNCPPGHVELSPRARRDAAEGTSSISSINTPNKATNDALTAVSGRSTYRPVSKANGKGAIAHDFSRYNYS